MFKEYLTYRFKSKKYLFIFISMIYLASIFATYISNMSFSIKAEIALGITFLFSFVLAFIMPILSLNYLHNRKSIDVYLTLPYSRKELLTMDLLYMFITVIIPWFILATFFFAITVITSHFLLINYIYILLTTISLVALIVFNSYLYLITNSMFDGIVIILAYTVAPLFFLMLCLTFNDIFVAGHFLNFDWIKYLSLPFLTLSSFFDLVNFFGNSFKVEALLYLFADTIFLIGSLYLIYRDFINRKFEKTNTPSDHPLSYPFIIYYYVFNCLFYIIANIRFERIFSTNMELMSLLLSLVFIFALFTLAHFIYRKKIYISLKMIIFYILSVVLCVMFIVGAKNSYGYGLANKYPNDYKEAEYTLYFDLNEDDFARIGIDSDKLYKYYLKNSEMAVSKEEVYSDLNVYLNIDSLCYRYKDDDIITIFENMRKEAIKDFYKEEKTYYNRHNNLYIDSDIIGTYESYRYNDSFGYYFKDSCRYHLEKKYLSKDAFGELLNHEGSKIYLNFQDITISKADIINLLKGS